MSLICLKGRLKVSNFENPCYKGQGWGEGEGEGAGISYDESFENDTKH